MKEQDNRPLLIKLLDEMDDIGKKIATECSIIGQEEYTKLLIEYFKKKGIFNPNANYGKYYPILFDFNNDKIKAIRSFDARDFREIAENDKTRCKHLHDIKMDKVGQCMDITCDGLRKDCWLYEPKKRGE